MLSNFTMKDLVNAGVHYGHLKKYMHPAIQPYIYGERDNVCIIDLDKTYISLHTASEFLGKLAARGGRILFVSTKKRQSFSIVKQVALSCGQYYVNYRWLGGMLTNWKTVSNSIKMLRVLEETIAMPETHANYTKKELSIMKREYDRLNLTLGGIRNMNSLPDALVVIDIKAEANAVKEAKDLGIPVVALVDTDSDPRIVEHPIPANDDGRKSIALCCHILSQAIIKSMMIEQEQEQEQKQA